MKMLIIVRGLPGSGKSTYASALAKRYGISYFEADMYFVDQAGNYNFNSKSLGKAHTWCQEAVHGELVKKKSVIVSNTFTTWKEMEPYVEMAAHEGFLVKIIQMNGKWQNTHDVPAATIEKMQARFVPNKLLPQNGLVDYSEVY